MGDIKKYIRLTPIDLSQEDMEACIGILHCKKAYSEFEGTPAFDEAEVGDVTSGVPSQMKDDEFYDAYHVHVLSRTEELYDGDHCYHPDFGIQPCCDMTGSGMDNWYEMGWRKLIYSSDPNVQLYGVDSISVNMMKDFAEVLTTEDF